MANQELTKLVGQLFIVGFPTQSVPADFKKFIQDYNLGGTIYFKHNVESAAQLAELSNDLQFGARIKSSPGLLICIDHEGGRVNRLVKPFTKFPSADHLGELNSPKVGFMFGSVIGKELKAVGINLNFCPVVDVATNPNSPALKTRMFSADPEIVAKIGSAVCRGLQKAGVAAVAKHFPGHGDATEDSHFALPKVDKSLKELEDCELIPFRRMVRSRCEGIMSAHIVNPSLDPEYPATLSKKTITELLRGSLRFSKVVFTDDMEMKAITEHYGKDEAAVLAVQAGCDMLIFRGDHGATVSQIEAIVKAVEDKRIARAQIEASVGRIMSCKRAYVNVMSPVSVTEVGKSIGLPEHFRLADCIAKKELPPDIDRSEDGDRD